MNKKYFMSETEGDTLQITIFGDITSWEFADSDVSSYTLSKLINESTAKKIIVNINSYGGEVAEGLAIYNSLKNSKAKVTTRCDGFACSAASVVFMAGDKREMNEASLLMIHNAWTYAEGNAAELRKQADDLEIISKTLANAYLSCVNISEDELQALLDAETWITPEQAVAMGFATKIVGDSGKKHQDSAKKEIIRQLVEGRCKGAVPDASGTEPDEPKAGAAEPEPTGGEPAPDAGADGDQTSDEDDQSGEGSPQADGTDPTARAEPAPVDGFQKLFSTFNRS
jgi:ATP-dependent Clp protease protease subunit